MSRLITCHIPWLSFGTGSICKCGIFTGTISVSVQALICSLPSLVKFGISHHASSTNQFPSIISVRSAFRFNSVLRIGLVELLLRRTEPEELFR
ncbi:MAG TPA: hypothetical protein DCR53_11030 [Afipia sp.]|nr:hypothetical protein [Afipia sp.]